MVTIISSIIGAFIGALFTWLINRRKPHHIICEETYRGYYSWRELPDTQIIVHDTPIEILGILELNFRNIGSLAIESPKITVSLDEDIQILNVINKISPLRGDFVDKENNNNGEITSSKEEAVAANVENNKLLLNIDRLIPYDTNHETLKTEIFTNGKIKDVQVFGNGVLRDGSAWAVSFKSSRETHTKRYKIMTFLSTSSLFILLILTVMNIYKYLPQIMTLSGMQDILNRCSGDPLLWMFAGWTLLTLAWHIYFGWQGVYINIPVPFTSKELRIGFWKRR